MSLEPQTREPLVITSCNRIPKQSDPFKLDPETRHRDVELFGPNSMNPSLLAACWPWAVCLIVGVIAARLS